MKLFKRKRYENTGMPEMNDIKLSTILSTASISPLPYEHSDKFIMDGINPLAVERERIKNKSVDWLIHDKRDASIEADSREEIVYGKRQFTNHVYCVSLIIAKHEGEIQASMEQEKLILAEIEYYNKLEAQFSKQGA